MMKHKEESNVRIRLSSAKPPSACYDKFLQFVRLFLLIALCKFSFFHVVFTDERSTFMGKKIDKSEAG